MSDQNNKKEESQTGQLSISGGMSLSQRLQMIQKQKEKQKIEKQRQKEVKEGEEQEEGEPENYYGRIQDSKNSKQEEEREEQEENENEEEENKEEEEEETETTTQQPKPRSLGGQSYGFGKKMTPQQQKLAELRNKLSKIRTENHKLVLAEDKKNSQPSSSDQKKARQEWEEEEEKRLQELKQHGIDPEADRLMNLPAAQAELRAKKFKKVHKQKQQGLAISDLGLSDPAVHHRAYKRKLADMEKDQNVFQEYQKQKQITPETEFYATADNLSHGKAPKVSEEKLDKLVEDMDKNAQKRFKFSRRRAHVADKTVDYINDRNQKFNSKVARAFDKYTVEIKNNLERGTAI